VSQSFALRKLTETFISDLRKRHASGAPSAPPQKKPDTGSTPPPPPREGAKRSHRANKKKGRRGQRSDRALKERGFKLVYVTGEDGGRLEFELWKEVEDGVIDRIFVMTPDEEAFPGARGFPRIARMAYNGGHHFMACADDATAAWAQAVTLEILQGKGIKEPKFSDQGPHEGMTPYCVVLPARVEKWGPEETAKLVLRQNRWPGTAKPLRGFVKPSGEGDNRPVVLLYFVVDKAAEEAIVLDGFKGYVGNSEVRLRRKARSSDGTVAVELDKDLRGAEDKDKEDEETPASTTTTTNTTST